MIFKRFVITGGDGTPYLIRYTLLKTRWGAVYLHKFLRSDEDRCLHDHPWPFISLILKGGYVEETPEGCRFYPPGSVLFRPAQWKHRVHLYYAGGKLVQPWTLVVRGKKKREWGFWTVDGWKPWKYFLDRKNEGIDQC